MLEVSLYCTTVTTHKRLKKKKKKINKRCIYCAVLLLPYSEPPPTPPSQAVFKSFKMIYSPKTHTKHKKEEEKHRHSSVMGSLHLSKHLEFL